MEVKIKFGIEDVSVDFAFHRSYVFTFTFLSVQIIHFGNT